MEGPYRIPASNEEVELGEVVSRHAGRPTAFWITLGASTAIMLVVWLIVGPGALFTLPLIAFGLARQAWLIPRLIVLYREGVEVHALAGTRQRFRFDACDAVYRSLVTIGGRRELAYALRLVDAARKSVTVRPDVEDPQSLFAAIERECVQPVRREAFEAFSRGEALSFGPIRLDRGGVSLGRDHVRWDQLDRVDVGANGLRFHVREGIGRRTYSFAEVPYPFVLIDLLKRAGAVS